MLKHIETVSRKRNYYRDLCNDTKEQIKSVFTTNGDFTLPPVTLSFAVMSLDTKVHYSFDMAQQV